MESADVSSQGMRQDSHSSRQRSSRRVTFTFQEDDAFTEGPPEVAQQRDVLAETIGPEALFLPRPLNGMFTRLLVAREKAIPVESVVEQPRDQPRSFISPKRGRFLTSANRKLWERSQPEVSNASE